jgi:hypothetical protein
MILTQTEGVSNSQGNVVAGELDENGVQPMSKGGSGGAQGNSDAVGTSNAFIGGPLGAASAGGSSGGNSSAIAKIAIESEMNALGVITSVGQGIGASGGRGVFGPSLAGAVAAATPDPTAVPDATVTATDQNSKKKGKKGEAQAETETVQMEAPELIFSFTSGLPTGGGGVGFGIGTGTVNATVESTDTEDQVTEASGGGLATGFGFGVGNGAGQNKAREYAGGSGGGTALGAGALAIEVDDILYGAFTSTGTTESVGASAGYVGLNPVLPKAFFDELLTIRSPSAPLAGANGASAGGAN